MQINTVYSKTSQLLHWSMALIILSMLFLGLSMVQSLAVWQIEAIQLHKSFGVLALFLAIVRWINKVISKSPALPNEISKWQKIAAHTTHTALYISMLLMPISGWLMQNSDGRIVNIFDLIVLPQLVNADIYLYGLFREMHELIAWLFIIIIFMHVGAALYHGLIKQDGVLSSMVRRKRKVLK